ncbi:MAG: FecR domain-containing protein [Bacteroidota bacterium]
MNNRENIDELISKFLSGEALPEEAMQLEDWKNESSDNMAYYEQYETVFALTGSYSKAAETNTQKAWEKVQQDISHDKVKPLYTKMPYLKIAAALVLLVGFGVAFLFLFNSQNKQSILYVAGNQPKQVKLPDGTEVTVLANSSLTADKDFGIKNRLLHLKGNAYFSVTHSEELPFVIDAGNVFIKDIGTKFSVRSSLDTDTVYVNVDEGIVLLFDSMGSVLEIKASEKALYIRSKKQIIKGDAAEVKQNEAIHFSNARLGDVIATLNTTYNTTIVLENAALKDCSITTKFEQEKLETIIVIITETLGLSYEKTETGYLIKGHSCHP